MLLGRDGVSDINEENIFLQSPDTLAKIRKWLLLICYDDEDSEFAKHLASHLTERGQWLVQSNAYKECYSSEDNGLLWICGASTCKSNNPPFLRKSRSRADKPDGNLKLCTKEYDNAFVVISLCRYCNLLPTFRFS